MKYLIIGFHHERRKHLWRLGNVHAQDAASIEQSLYATPKLKCELYNLKFNINSFRWKQNHFTTATLIRTATQSTDKIINIT